MKHEKYEIHIVNDSMIYNKFFDGGKKLRFICKKYPELRTLDMNDISTYIWKMCLENKDIDTMTNELSKKYIIDNITKLREDVLVTLYYFWNLGLIEWKGEMPFQCYLDYGNKEGIVARIILEKDIDEKIRKLINIRIDKKYIKSYYSNYRRIQLNILLGKEQYCEVYQNNRKVMVCSIGSCYKRKSLQLHILLIEKFEYHSNISEWLQWLIKEYCFVTQTKEYNKILTCTYEDDEKEIYDFLKFLSFDEIYKDKEFAENDDSYQTRTWWKRDIKIR